MSDNSTLVRPSSTTYSLKNIKTGEIFQISTHSTVGRQKNCDIEIPDKHISRLHASLKVKGMALLLTHEGSNNGTFVNDIQIKECVLNANDIVKFDTHEFEVLALSEENTEFNFKNESSKQDDDTASTLVLPEVWADAKQKSTSASKKIKAPSTSARDSDERIKKSTPPKPDSNLKNSTKMNNLLSTQVLFADENDKNDKNDKKYKLNNVIEEGVIHLFGYHTLIHDEVFPLNKNIILIGKASENDIVLNDASVSSKHAKIFIKKNSWLVEDLNSTNGTFINGQQIKQATILKRGDLIQFGLIQLVFAQLKPKIKETFLSRFRKWSRLPE